MNKVLKLIEKNKEFIRMKEVCGCYDLFQVWENGRYSGKYHGETKDGLPHGFGEWGVNDHSYEGRWKNGKKSGRGSYEIFLSVEPFRRSMLSGIWEDDRLIKGRVWVCANSTTIYEGTFDSDHKLHGKNCKIKVNNLEHIGRFEHGVPVDVKTIWGLLSEK